MGRKRSRFHHLPPRMRARVRGRVTYYFYDQRPAKPAEVPLGRDYAEAIRKWAELESGRHAPVPEVITFRHVAERYQREVIPLKSPRTQVDNGHELAKLLAFFDDPPAPLAKIEPQHVAAYMEWRTNKGKTALVRANREKALLSHIWNKARKWGYTALPNPCRGVEGNRETGRKVYVEDDVFAAVWEAADQPLRDALDLAYLVGQRVADTRSFDAGDVRDGALFVEQGKTGAKRRIALDGDLKAVLKRIERRKEKIPGASTRLVVDENGQPLRRDQLRYRFDKARELAGVPKSIFQFRDIRAKAGTDRLDAAGDITQAQRLLGHSSVAMTEHYIRNRKGEKVAPSSRRTVVSRSSKNGKLRNKTGIAEKPRKR